MQYLISKISKKCDKAWGGKLKKDQSENFSCVAKKDKVEITQLFSLVQTESGFRKSKKA